MEYSISMHKAIRMYWRATVLDRIDDDSPFPNKIIYAVLSFYYNKASAMDIQAL